MHLPLNAHFVADPGAEPLIVSGGFLLPKNDLIGRIRAITISVKIKTACAEDREVPGSLNARETNSANGIRMMSGRNGKTRSGNAQTHTTINITNHAGRALLTYPVQVMISPMKIIAMEATPRSPIVWAAVR